MRGCFKEKGRRSCLSQNNDNTRMEATLRKWYFIGVFNRVLDAQGSSGDDARIDLPAKNASWSRMSIMKRKPLISAWDSRSGVTLVELLVVILIVTILSVALLPLLGPFIVRARYAAEPIPVLGNIRTMVGVYKFDNKTTSFPDFPRRQAERLTFQSQARGVVWVLLVANLICYQAPVRTVAEPIRCLLTQTQQV